MSKKTLELCKKIKLILIPIFQVKKNQKQLLQNLQHTAKFNNPVKDISNKDKPESKRNRIEVRQIRTYKPNTTNPYQLGYITDEYWRKKIKVIIQLKRIIKIKDTKASTKTNLIYKTTTETAYYFTTTATLPAKQLNQIIRNHWAIENKNHYVRDTALKEGKSRVRKNPMIMATIRSLFLNILRSLGITNIVQSIRKNSWSNQFFDDCKWLWTNG